VSGLRGGSTRLESNNLLDLQNLHVSIVRAFLVSRWIVDSDGSLRSADVRHQLFRPEVLLVGPFRGFP
jgi:hypothetical protein